MREPPLPSGRDCCLFLDIDGTLVDIAPTPDAVRVDESVRTLLRSLEIACGGALALVTGRTIPEVDELFDPLFLPVAGVHGCERRDGQGYWHRHAWRTPAFEEFSHRVGAAVATLAGVMLEDKGCGIALHYRLAPRMESPLRAALHSLSSHLPETHWILEGDQVIEVKPRAPDKGSAIDSFMAEPPFAGRFPIAIGDDQTDRDSFAAVRQRGGLAIAVGGKIHSEWQLADPVSVKRWLNSFLLRRPAA